MAIINTKFKLPLLEQQCKIKSETNTYTDRNANGNTNTCSKNQWLIQPYPTSLCSFYKLAVKYHIIYTGIMTIITIIIHHQ